MIQWGQVQNENLDSPIIIEKLNLIKEREEDIKNYNNKLAYYRETYVYVFDE